jgi:hypothetical protein
MRVSRTRTCLYVALAILLRASPARLAFAADAPSMSAAEIDRLVKNTVWNEVEAAQHPAARFAYEEIDATAEGSTTSEQVETPEGVIARLLKVNGRGPSSDRQARDVRKLRSLLTDPEAQRSLLVSQQGEMHRRMNLLKEFPNAFRFNFEAVQSDGSVRLSFSPRPGYHPSSHEGLALEGMQGTMWINRSEQRVAKIDGTLVRNVSLGWGIAAKLYSGGHFLLQQTEVAKDRWRTTLLSVDLRGRILLVKGLDVHLRQTRRSFHPVPDNLSVAQAVGMLVGRGPQGY